MSYVLPKETQTQKVSSLPEDLKGIAEELIKDKFKVKEKKERRAQDDWGPFPSQSAWTTGTFAGSAGYVDSFTSNVHNRWEREGVRVEINPYTRERIYRSIIRTRRGSALEDTADAMRALDEENLPNRDRVIYISRSRYENLAMDPSIVHHSDLTMTPKLWGAEIRVVPPNMMEHIAQVTY